MLENRFFLRTCGVLCLIGLYLTSLYNYLLFHSLAEMFSIAVAWGIFFIAWNTRKTMDSRYFLFMGIAYFFIGFMDLLHTLAYKGMGIFHGYDANLPTQLWIAGRYLESFSFGGGLVFVQRPFNSKVMFAGFTLLTALVTVSIFTGMFPDCFVKDQGLTGFKKISEILISFILLGAIPFLWRARNMFDKHLLKMIIFSILLTVAAEMCFIFYVSVYGLSNLMGHYLKIISFYFIYRGVIETGLSNPVNLLFQDLNAHKEALEKSEQRYRSLFENMLNGAAYHKILVDEENQPTDYIFLEVNKAFEDHSGLSREVIIGKKVTEILPDIKSSEFDWIAAYGNVALKGGILQIEQYSESLGKWFDICAFSPEKGYFAVTFTDITERRHIMEELKRAKSELEQRVQDRTRELKAANLSLEREVSEHKQTEALLKDRNAELEQSNRQLDEFAYIAAHDLREPLRGIYNLSAILLEDYGHKLDDEGNSMIRSLMRLAKRQNDQVAAIHHYSRISQAEMIVEMTDLNTLIHEVIDSLQLLLNETRAHVHLPRPLPMTRCSRFRVREVFSNLIANAVKYNDKEEKRIEIGFRENRITTFYVRDNGIGIRKNHFDKVFNIFKRLNNDKTYGPGTGVGLTIVRKIIERHNGKLWLESEVGKGTTFYFTLEAGNWKLETGDRKLGKPETGDWKLGKPRRGDIFVAWD